MSKSGSHAEIGGLNEAKSQSPESWMSQTPDGTKIGIADEMLKGTRSILRMREAHETGSGGLKGHQIWKLVPKWYSCLVAILLERASRRKAKAKLRLSFDFDWEPKRDQFVICQFPSVGLVGHTSKWHSGAEKNNRISYFPVLFTKVSCLSHWFEPRSFVLA